MSSARDNLHLDQRSTENEELILKFSSDEAENVTPMHLEFKNVTVVSDDVTLLDNVCGDVKPGEVLAIMGPSGAGKTTLLTLLAGREMKSTGEMTAGSITVNGEPMTKRVRRRIGYVLQEDVFFSHLTVQQTLQFAGELRLPDTLSKSMKMEKVNHLIDCLGLRKCSDIDIGGGLFVKGISGGERKRTSIAVELITNPSLLLMDEPTSGLDSSTAMNLVSTLKTLARAQNRAIVTTIHQPSSHVFHMFDKLMLLCNGQVAYFGDVPGCLKFFESINMPCYPNWNPADYVMEKLTAGPVVERAIVDGYAKSSIFQEYKKSIEFTPNTDAKKGQDQDKKVEDKEEKEGEIKGKEKSEEKQEDEKEGDKENHLSMEEKEGLLEVTFNGDARVTVIDKPDDVKQKKKQKKWPTSFLTQFRVLASRAFIQTKSDILDKVETGQVIALSIIISLVWFQTPYKEESIMDKQGVLFFVAMDLSFGPLFAALMSFPVERNVIAKERAAGMYRLSAYFMAKCVSELPLVLLNPFIMHTIVYWSTGMNASPYYLLSVVTIFITVVFAQSLGLLISALVKDLRQSITVAVICGVGSMLLAGFYTKNIPYWLRWAKYVSFMTYSYNAFLRIEFYHNPKTFSCATTLSNFPQCANRNSTITPIITGEEVYNMYSTVSFTIWQSWLAVIGLTILTRLGCYMGLRHFNKPR